MVKVTQTEMESLKAKNGVQRINFWVDVLKSNGAEKRIKATGNVELDSSASISRTASLTIAEELEWLDIELRVVVEIDGRDFPLGIFIPASPTERFDADGASTYDVECYDRASILKQAGLIDPLYFKQNTRYTDAIKTVLSGANINNVIWSDLSPIAMPTARVFEEATSKLDLINTLLDEINFDPIFCNENGDFIIRAHREPDVQIIDITYDDGDMSVLGPVMVKKADDYGVPNVFTVTLENPDIDVTLRSVYINDDPGDKHSAIRRGIPIVKKVDPPDAISSKSELDIWLKRKVKALSTVQDTVEFRTLIMPIHGYGDIIALNTKKYSGAFQEQKWSIPLSAGGYMSHTVRRLL